MPKRHLKLQATLADRFADKFLPEPNSGCWLWTGGIKEGGYGVIGLGRREQGTDKAHRVSYRLHCGPIPAGLNVLHRCDNPYCVNPEHLFLGSLKDNSRDCVAKGRLVLPDNRGERATWSKLSEDDVREIRKREMSGVALARRFGVSRSAIYEIWRGKNWGSVT